MIILVLIIEETPLTNKKTSNNKLDDHVEVNAKVGLGISSSGTDHLVKAEYTH